MRGYQENAFSGFCYLLGYPVRHQARQPRDSDQFLQPVT